MDLYLINGHDGISLPEMIDWDIKLCDSDISKEVGVNNSLGLGYDLPSLDIEEDPNPLWPQSYSANSNSSFELDFLGEGASSLMVDPNSVMPFVTSRRREQEHCVEPVKDEPSQDNMGDYNYADQLQTAQIMTKVEVKHKKEEEKELIVPEVQDDDIDEEAIEANVDVDDINEQNVTYELTNKTDIVSLPIEFVNVPSAESAYIEVIPAKKPSPQKRQVIPTLNNVTLKSYPKPAYSYSCLIAMALKNSLTGSLPVSEIYSFMCHHFPYFKTAPNGWKNSVRHNLSLNKCFEKIEKPPGSGNNGSQRKGCLWAMNPAKITKMDDEVAKWSKKDPSAIKKAMVFPDNLELLERGELKDDAAFGGDETEEESEEVKEEETEDDFGIDVEDERISPIDDDSEDEISTIPPSLQPFEPKFANLNRHKLLPSRIDLIGKSSDIVANVDFEVNNGVYHGAGANDTRTLLGLDESTPIYAVDPNDENLLIELPLVKRPRVQGNYIYQPMMNVKRHNIGGFRSLKIQTP